MMDADKVGAVALDIAASVGSILLPPLAPVALAVEPLLRQYLFGPGDDARSAAQAANTVIAQVAGTADPAAAQAALADPVKRADASAQLAALIGQIEHQRRLDDQAAADARARASEARQAAALQALQTQLADVQDARKRDLALLATSGPNRRASIMVLCAAAGLLVCLGTVALGHLSDLAMAQVGTIGALFGLCLRDAYCFEFGTSRGQVMNAQQLAAQTADFSQSLKQIAMDTVPVRLLPGQALALPAPPDAQP